MYLVAHQSSASIANGDSQRRSQIPSLASTDDGRGLLHSCDSTHESTARKTAADSDEPITAGNVRS
jgi:hypothetical protein